MWNIVTDPQWLLGTTPGANWVPVHNTEFKFPNVSEEKLQPKSWGGGEGYEYARTIAPVHAS